MALIRFARTDGKSKHYLDKKPTALTYPCVGIYTRQVEEQFSPSPSDFWGTVQLPTHRYFVLFDIAMGKPWDAFGMREMLGWALAVSTG